MKTPPTRHNSPQLGLWTRLIPHWINSSTTCYRTACSRGLTTLINISVYSALCHFTFTRKKLIFVHLDFNRTLQRCCGGVLLCYVKPHWTFIFHFLSLNYSSDVIFVGQIQLWGCSQQLKSPAAYSGFKYCTVRTIYRQLSEPSKLTFHKQLKATELFYNRNRIKLLRRNLWRRRVLYDIRPSSRLQCTCFSLQSSTPSSVSCCLSCKPSSKVLIWPSTYALSLCPRFLEEGETGHTHSHHRQENTDHPCYGHQDGAIQFLRAHKAAGIQTGKIE